MTCNNRGSVWDRNYAGTSRVTDLHLDTKSASTEQTHTYL